jgi:predicted NAD/FAD-binding protein
MDRGLCPHRSAADTGGAAAVVDVCAGHRVADDVDTVVGVDAAARGMGACAVAGGDGGGDAYDAAVVAVGEDDGTWQHDETSPWPLEHRYRRCHHSSLTCLESLP